MKGFMNWLTKSFSLRTLLIAHVLIFTIVPTAFIVKFSIAYTENIITNKYMSDYSNGANEEIKKNLSSIIYQANSIALNFTTNQNIYSCILSKNMSEQEKNAILHSEVSKVLNEESVVAGVSILTDESNYNFTDIPQELCVSKGSFTNQITRSNLILYDKAVEYNGTNYIILGKKFYNYYNGYDIGYLLIYIDEQTFCDTYKKFELSQDSLFLMMNDRIISHIDKSLIGSKLFLSNQYFDSGDLPFTLKKGYSIIKIKVDSNFLLSNIYMVNIVDNTNLNNMVATITHRIIIIFFVIFILSIIFSVVISRKLLVNIVDLKSNMKLFMNRQETTDVTSPSNELWALNKMFNKMATRINELLQKNNEEKEKQRISELRALQAQINPHFIYNALDSICWMARKKNQPEIYKMGYSLASFFRLALNSGENIVMVKDEIKHVKSYIDIEQIRFPNLFDVVWNIEDKILELHMLNIILQPVVENAIKHGFKNMKNGGIISITGRLTENNNILFQISDNGKGFQASLKDDHYTEKHSGYGIRNIQERLKLKYGTGYGLSYKSTPNKGTDVFILLRNID